MKNLSKIQIDVSRILSNSDLRCLRGGDMEEEECCHYYPLGALWWGEFEPQGTFCSDSQLLLENWTGFWNAAGYLTHCDWSIAWSSFNIQPY